MSFCGPSSARLSRCILLCCVAWSATIFWRQIVIWGSGELRSTECKSAGEALRQTFLEHQVTCQCISAKKMMFIKVTCRSQTTRSDLTRDAHQTHGAKYTSQEHCWLCLILVILSSSFQLGGKALWILPGISTPLCQVFSCSVYFLHLESRVFGRKTEHYSYVRSQISYMPLVTGWRLCKEQKRLTLHQNKFPTLAYQVVSQYAQRTKVDNQSPVQTPFSCWTRCKLATELAVRSVLLELSYRYTSIHRVSICLVNTVWHRKNNKAHIMVIFPE